MSVVEVSHHEHFDVLIIGSGEAGKDLAWSMAEAGRRTAVVKGKLIGGSCPNIACSPSKNIIYTAKVVQLAPRRGVRSHDAQHEGRDANGASAKTQDGGR
jgi:pyruvate/2-oxoglutarate dehydrogenase complex dihydrolipoamide dehydrogenase (E3) component